MATLAWSSGSATGAESDRARRTSAGSGRPSSRWYSSAHLLTSSRARRCSPRATSAFTRTAVQSAWKASRRSASEASSTASAGAPAARAASDASYSSDWTQFSSRYRWSASQESKTALSAKESPSSSWPSTVRGSRPWPLAEPTSSRASQCQGGRRVSRSGSPVMETPSRVRRSSDRFQRRAPSGSAASGNSSMAVRERLTPSGCRAR